MVTSELIAELKGYLAITWNDMQTEIQLTGMLNRGMDYLKQWGGEDLDFHRDGVAKALLFDYCRYARSYALDEFRVNYAKDLLELQLATAAEKKEESDDSEENTELS